MNKTPSENVEIVFLSDMELNTIDETRDGKYSGFDYTHWSDFGSSYPGFEDSYRYGTGVLSNLSEVAAELKDGLIKEYSLGADIYPDLIEPLMPEEYQAYRNALDTHGLGSDQFNSAYNDLVAALNVGITADNAKMIYDSICERMFAAKGMTFANGNLYSISQIMSASLDYYRNYLYENRSIYEGKEITLGNKKVTDYKTAYDYLFLQNLIMLHPQYYLYNGVMFNKAADLPFYTMMTINAVNDFANNTKVNEIKLINFKNIAESWANPDASTVDHIKGDKFKYLTGTGNFTTTLETLSNLVINTDMQGAYVEDPMSEYVNLDVASIKIYQDDAVIYENGAWKAGVTPPCTGTGTPVTIDERADGTKMITWHVKDGVLTSTDNYKLTYDVTLKDGLDPNGSYPANGETILTYTSVKASAPKTKSLRVPKVGKQYFVDIVSPKEGAEYKVYKIFDVTYDGTGAFAYTYTSDTYGTNEATELDKLVAKLVEDNMLDISLNKVPGTDTYVITKDSNNNGVATPTAAPSEDKESNYALELQECYKDGMFDNIVPNETVTAGEGEDEIIVDVSNHGAGYYFVTTSNGSFVLVDTTDNTAYVKEKNVDPSIDKEITNKVGDNKDDDFKLGDTVNYMVTIDAQAGAINYKTVDTCPLGLTLDATSILVKFGTDTLVATGTNRDYTLDVTPATETAGSIITINFAKSFLDGINAQNEENDIVITYSGTVNDKAVAGANPNTVTLTWGANSEFSDDDTEEFYTAEYKFIKADKDDHTKTLAGVKFKVYNAATAGTQLGFNLGDDGIYYYTGTGDTVLITDANGEIHMDLLEAGTYYLEEIETLPGYNLPTERFAITVAKGSSDVDDLNVIENSTGVELPETGGIGTKIFVGVGMLAVLVAGIVLVSNKRISKEEL